VIVQSHEILAPLFRRARIPRQRKRVRVSSDPYQTIWAADSKPAWPGQLARPKHEAAYMGRDNSGERSEVTSRRRDEDITSTAEDSTILLLGKMGYSGA